MWPYRTGKRLLFTCAMSSALYLLFHSLAAKLRLSSERGLRKFDPLTATASNLQHLLSSGKLTSVELCQVYLDQILQHDHYLKAVLAVGPTALSQAAVLDEERLQGRVRGPLHGIPILVKVSCGRRIRALCSTLTAEGQHRHASRARNGYHRRELGSKGLPASTQCRNHR